MVKNMTNFFSQHIQIAHERWKQHLQTSDIAVDMTCGNGRDTLVLCQCLPQGQVYGFDVQAAAIEQTKLTTHKYSNVHLFCNSHTAIKNIAFTAAPRLIIYNLGYLPGGDKSIVTNTETTLCSLKSSLDLLAVDGAISITCYPGHEEGAREELAIISFLQDLPSNQYYVNLQRWINRPKSPSFIWLRQIS